MEAAQGLATLPQLLQFKHVAPCLSAEASTLETSTRRWIERTSKTTSIMTPFLCSKIDFREGIDHDGSPGPPTKRVRLTFSNGLHQIHNSGGLQRASSYGAKEINELPICSFQPFTPHLMGSRMSDPTTPASSSTKSDEARQSWRLAAKLCIPQDQHVQRVSVGSLLLSSPETQHSQTIADNPAQAYDDSTALSPILGEYFSNRQQAKSSFHPKCYGLDCGFPDIDIPKNDDSTSISGVPHSQNRGLDAWLEHVELRNQEFGPDLQKVEFVFAKGGYYASPVLIKIPRTLEPLPSALLESPMNLLYFHHFLNHTAKVLVFHDCSRNPFRTILPQSKLFKLFNEFTTG